MSKVTLGGDRLGAGNQQKVDLHNYNRSTHDLSYIWRSTMASGTLVPFMSEVGLPGDNFTIDLEADIKTHPTIGPLFGSYKVQLDVFSCPIRLYNGKLHMNLINIGLNMSAIKLPQVRVTTNGTATNDNGQINSSALLSYLNIRGAGRGDDVVTRDFNAISLLSYWDIYKNYYANKQEEIGAYIHNPQNIVYNTVDEFTISDSFGDSILLTTTIGSTVLEIGNSGEANVRFAGGIQPDIATLILHYGIDGVLYASPMATIFNSYIWNAQNNTYTFSDPIEALWGDVTYIKYAYSGQTVITTNTIQISTFPLSNIDLMREDILVQTQNTNPFIIDENSVAPYGPPLLQGEYGYCLTSTQEGLALKTYQSDLFNNWISTEWIDGENGINQITAVDTSTGEFTLNTLQLSNKVYEMLNRIAVSGGSYDDWLNAVYTHERTRSQENPMYMGGLIKELGFQEVISNAQAEVGTNAQPLGTLAGRGVMTKKNKGGKINIRVDEPSYIMGIVSLTPRIDYSQGNKWDTNLKTLDDLHKPALDEIGFQDLITDQQAWWDTEILLGEPVFKSAGKQPAWINYMTNVNQTRGNFAVQEGLQTSTGGQMFMTLNRRYEKDSSGNIKDLTTYIDPSKFNNIFADTRLDAQNFWTQIAVNITARRKMSAKLMPNL